MKVAGSVDQKNVTLAYENNAQTAKLVTTKGDVIVGGTAEDIVKRFLTRTSLKTVNESSTSVDQESFDWN